jgi:hypothetical protein
MSDRILVAIGTYKSIEGTHNWYGMPSKLDVVWIASRRPLPWYEVQIWFDYMSTVKDLLSAGF